MNPLPRNLRKPSHSNSSFNSTIGFDPIVISCLFHIGPVDMLLAGQRVPRQSTLPGNLLPSTACFSASMTFGGRSPSILVAGRSDIIKFNIDRKIGEMDTKITFLPPFAQGEYLNPNQTTTNQIFVGADTGTEAPAAGHKVFREVFHYHKAPVILLDVVGRVSDTYVSVDEDGFVALWSYSATFCDSSGWLRPVKTYRINLDLVEYVEDKFCNPQLERKDSEFPPFDMNTKTPSTVENWTDTSKYKYRLKSRFVDRKGNIVEVFHPVLASITINNSVKPCLCEVSRRLDIDLKRRRDSVVAEKRRRTSVKAAQKLKTGLAASSNGDKKPAGGIISKIFNFARSKRRSKETQQITSPVLDNGDIASEAPPMSNSGDSASEASGLTNGLTNGLTSGFTNGSKVIVGEEDQTHALNRAVQPASDDKNHSLNDSNTLGSDLVLVDIGGLSAVSVVSSQGIVRDPGDEATAEHVGTETVDKTPVEPQPILTEKRFSAAAAAKRRTSIIEVRQRVAEAQHSALPLLATGGEKVVGDKMKSVADKILQPVGWKERAVREVQYSSRLLQVRISPEGNELYFLAACAGTDFDEPVSGTASDSMISPRSVISDDDSVISPPVSPLEKGVRQAESPAANYAKNSGGTMFLIVAFDIERENLQLPLIRIYLPPGDLVQKFWVGPLTTETLTRFIHVHTIFSIKVYSSQTGRELNSVPNSSLLAEHGPAETTAAANYLYPIRLRDFCHKGAVIASVCGSSRVIAVGCTENNKIALIQCCHDLDHERIMHDGSVHSRVGHGCWGGGYTARKAVADSVGSRPTILLKKSSHQPGSTPSTAVSESRIAETEFMNEYVDDILVYTCDEVDRLAALKHKKTVIDELYALSDETSLGSLEPRTWPQKHEFEYIQRFEADAVVASVDNNVVGSSVDQRQVISEFSTAFVLSTLQISLQRHTLLLQEKLTHDSVTDVLQSSDVDDSRQPERQDPDSNNSTGEIDYGPEAYYQEPISVSSDGPNLVSEVKQGEVSHNNAQHSELLVSQVSSIDRNEV
jgi:hypothetical protein